MVKYRDMVEWSSKTRLAKRKRKCQQYSPTRFTPVDLLTFYGITNLCRRFAGLVGPGLACPYAITMPTRSAQARPALYQCGITFSLSCLILMQARTVPGLSHTQHSCQDTLVGNPERSRVPPLCPAGVSARRTMEIAGGQYWA